MRLILFLAVLALGADALFYSGTYTQAVYQEISTRVGDFASDIGDGDESSARTEREATAPRDRMNY